MMKDIDREIATMYAGYMDHPTIGHPRYQTDVNLIQKFSDKSGWKELFQSLQTELVDYDKNYSHKIISCWANLTTIGSTYEIHKHQCPVTAVFYLQTPSPEYGTQFYSEITPEEFEPEFLIEGEENSLVIFDARVPHEMVEVPLDVLKECNRYTIAFDIDFQ